ncbi:M14 family zinc carboxypeptidase [uncultured Winogradskyella sp.]|uniref:M14 family zinc carboxypeptidase n=1 Tax=uncultured Winogradskyella sp. TaxID=395353 RepID=UPI0026249E0B|nr:M14 family zinc carboxypeptidase [uncultured Winogradskyella sp.]
MRKIAPLTLLISLFLQISFAQNEHSRITINNPSQSTLDILAEQGIDLRCGVKHDHSSLTLDISDADRTVLQQYGIAYTTQINDLQTYYHQRAVNTLPSAITDAQLEDAKTKASRANLRADLQKSSTSSVILDNYLQYKEIDEKDWVKPLKWELGSMGGCYTISEVERELDEMRAYSQTNGLDIVSVKQDASPTGQTTWGNPSGTITNNGLTYSGQGTSRWDPQTIYYIRITGNESTTAEGTKPQLLFTSMIHSREVNALMGNMYFMWYLIENYNLDPAIKELVDNNELYFIPVVNPDGLRWNQHLSPTGGGMQRKNCRPNTGSTNNTTSTRGVDLNRNFDYFWGSAGTGSSGTPSSDSYRGPSAASEPETQIIVDFTLARNFKTAVWNHTFANSIPHPYGGNPSFTSGYEDEMHDMHAEMTRYNRYVSGATIFTPANGIADDWMVGGATDGNGSTGSGQNILATTPEHGGTGFWPSTGDIIPIAKRSVRISFAAAYYGGKYAKFHDLTQSDISSLSSNLDFAIERVGQTASDFTLAVTPISANITNITSPATQTGMSVLEQRNISAVVTLDPSIQPNDKIEYNVTLSNDDGVFYNINVEKYYQPSVLFFHDADTDGLTGWNNSGWNNTGADAYSGSNSLTTGAYGNNTNKTLTTTSGYNLSNSTKVLVQFYSKWDIERNFDFVELQASTNGTNWINLNGRYTKPESSASTNDHNAKSNADEAFQGNNASGHIYDGDRMDKWVMEEIVIDNLNNTALFGATNVFFRFRMRSDSENEFENYSANAEGFYFDDFKVISVTIPCSTIVPTGIVVDGITSSEATVTWEDVPSATYDLRYRAIGTTTWTEVTDIAIESYVITGLDETTEYEVQIRTRCTNSTSAYSNSELFSTTEIVNCTGTVISSFSYTESFNGSIGDWIQNGSVDDDGDWLINTGGTPTGNTGPTDDISGGSDYLYIEASSNGTTGEIGANASAILTSPCYDLNNLPGGYFTFYYHAFGGDVATGSLELEISTDDGTNWTTIFSPTLVSENVWKYENIDLADYIGEVVKFRFIGTTGDSFSSDIAIDEVGIGSAILPDYCDSTATDTNYFLLIENVEFNTIDNNSNNDNQLYSDFTGVSTTVSKSTDYNLTITPQYNVATTNEVGYAAWIDFNMDGDFDDANENVFTQAPIAGGNPVNTTVTIPNNIVNGMARMRISMKFNAVPTSCETFQYGEVEDYNINLFNGLLYSNSTWTPNAPSDLTDNEDILILDGSFTTSTDINVKDVTINTGTEFNVAKANSVTINGNIFNNGEFIMDSDSNEFSSLIFNGVSFGDLKYKRHVNPVTNRNDLIAPPFYGESFISFKNANSNIVSNPASTLYLFGPFDKTSSDYITYSNTEVVSLESGKGYRTASTDNSTFTFTGSATTGSLDVPIQKTGSAFEIWNLIGNPYPSYIDLEDFLTANISEFDSESAAVYGYDADNTDGSYWTVYNLAYAATNPNTLIAPGQGFFVSSKDGGGSISFNPAMRSNGTSDDFISHRASHTIQNGTILMASATQSFSTDIFIMDNASLGLDLGYDASHFEGATDNFAIYSELVEDNNGKDMAIQAINTNDLSNTTVIPLGVNISQGEQVTISLTNSNINSDVYLEDVLTNTFTLLNDADYTFTADTNLSDIGRFYLRFEQNALTTNESELDKIQIYADDSAHQIVIKGLLSEKTKLTLYDMQGRQILKQQLNSNTTINTVDTNQFMQGVYLIQLDNGLSKISKKLIVR